jgi:hypothetical protein
MFVIALRQRAPEMRKLLFDTECEEARIAQDEHVRQHRMTVDSAVGPVLPNPAALTQGGLPQGMVVPPLVLPQGMLPQTVLPQAVQMYPGAQPVFFPNPLFYQSFVPGNPSGNIPNTPTTQSGQDPYAQMVSAAFFGQGMQQFTQNGV